MAAYFHTRHLAMADRYIQIFHHRIVKENRSKSTIRNTNYSPDLTSLASWGNRSAFKKRCSFPVISQRHNTSMTGCIAAVCLKMSKKRGLLGRWNRQGAGQNPAASPMWISHPEPGITNNLQSARAEMRTGDRKCSRFFRAKSCCTGSPKRSSISRYFESSRF